MWTTSPGSNRLIVSDPGDLYFCLDYREKDGVVEGSFIKGECDYSSLINISSTGPCILPLTAGDLSFAQTPTLSLALVWTILCVTAVTSRKWTNHFTANLRHFGSEKCVKQNQWKWMKRVFFYWFDKMAQLDKLYWCWYSRGSFFLFKHILVLDHWPFNLIDKHTHRNIILQLF